MIKTDSIQFKNFKDAIECNKLKDKGIDIDSVVKFLKKNGIRVSKCNKDF